MLTDRNTWFACAFIWLSLSGWAAAADPVVELTVNTTAFQGRSVAHNASWCWLASPSGAYRLVDLGEVTSFRKVGEAFRPDSVTQTAASLKKEYSKTLEVQTRGNYVVAAPRGRADQYVELMHSVHGSFTSYFGRKGWRLPEAEYPLVVMVLPTKAEFDERARGDGMSPSDQLQGYYHPLSNRVWLFDQPSSGGQAAPLSRGTAIHEGIHQLGFNLGLHSRIAPNPRWVVEGLATMLEAGALDNRGGTQATSARTNDSRLAHFREYRARREYALADFLNLDERLYTRAPLDFYSEAWALTFFLAETRRTEYTKYLQILAERDPLTTADNPTRRIEDFQKAFGKDLARLEVQFLRYVDSLP